MFASAEKVVVIPPTRLYPGGPVRRDLEDLASLLARERYELEVELGAPVVIDTARRRNRAMFVIGPRRANPVFDELWPGEVSLPTLTLDRSRQILMADAPDLEGVVEALSGLRTMTSSGVNHLEITDCVSRDEMIERVIREVEVTYPGFGLRGLDWAEICARHADSVRTAARPLAALQRWLAELADLHTGAYPYPPHGQLPYKARIDSGVARIMDVPEWSRGWDVGVRPGDIIEEPRADDAWQRTGGPRHSRPLLAGRRLLSGPVGELLQLKVRRHTGDTVELEEHPSYWPWPSPVEGWRLGSGTAYLRLRGFPTGVNARVDHALAEFAGADRLIVDLRGNAGGALVEALDFRDRFLDRPRQLGWIRFSTPTGGLSPPAAIEGRPALATRRWPGPVRFLSDSLTASASEDCLLGMRTLPNARVVGSATSGGSGRPRTTRLLPGMRLAVSTALTYDLGGDCVEGQGIQPDVPIHQVSLSEDLTLQAADADW